MYIHLMCLSIIRFKFYNYVQIKVANCQTIKSIELSIKYVQKRKLRTNFIKTGVSSSQGAKRSLVVVFQQV